MTHLLRRKIILHHPAIAPGSELWYLAGGVLPSICEGAWQGIGAASLAASYINLANPGTYDLTTTQAPTLVSAGWSCNGVDQFLNTVVVPTNINWSLIVRYSGLSFASDGSPIIGSRVDPAQSSWEIAPRPGPIIRYIHSDSWVTNYEEAAAPDNGVIGIAAKDIYRAGTYIATIPPAVNAGAFVQMTIGCLNDNGFKWAFCEVTVAALAIYNDTLSAAQMAAISSAMAAL